MRVRAQPTIQRLGVVAALAAGLLLPRAATADELPAGGWQQLEVGVLPVRYFGRTGEDLFHERPGVRPARAQAGRWQRSIEAALSSRDQLKILRGSQIREQLSHRRDYRRTTLLAERFAELGVTRYNDLQAAQALADFDRALQLYREVFADVADPDVVADAILYRGLILTEQGEAGKEKEKSSTKTVHSDSPQEYLRYKNHNRGVFCWGQGGNWGDDIGGSFWVDLVCWFSSFTNGYGGSKCLGKMGWVLFVQP